MALHIVIVGLSPKYYIIILCTHTYHAKVFL